MWNLERNIREFEVESILIIMFSGLMDIEKREDGLQVIHTQGAGTCQLHDLS
jgi:hypothetical protein